MWYTGNSSVENNVDETISSYIKYFQNTRALVMQKYTVFASRITVHIQVGDTLGEAADS